MMNIGKAAKASGVTSKMIRYYEEIGLVPAAERTGSGYRFYSERDVQRLRFVRRARDMGFSIPEIHNLLGLWSDRTRKSADVKQLAQAHISDLERRISELQQMANTLRTLVQCCAGDEQPDCPILEELEQPKATTGK